MWWICLYFTSSQSKVLYNRVYIRKFIFISIYLISNEVSCYSPNVIWSERFLRSEPSSCCLVGRKINDVTLGSCEFVCGLTVERRCTGKLQVANLLGPAWLGFVNYCALIKKGFLIFIIINFKGYLFSLVQSRILSFSILKFYWMPET